VVDARTNTLFVQDTPSRLVEVRKLIAKIDIPVRQVMIEARIVEADENFNKNLGAKLGYNKISSDGSRMPFNSSNSSSPRYAFGSTLGNVDSTSVGGTQNIAGAVPNGGLLSNLPAAGLNAFNPGVFSFILFNSALTQFLNMEISALEADGKGKTISSPRVLTADGVEALIEQGQEIPYQQATSSGATSVSFRKATLALKVKPQITPDGNIIMTLDVNKDEPGAITPGGVAINTKHVKTEVLVENGGTVVIGGIFEQRDRTDITRVPFFGDLPYIGFLFKNNTTSTSKTELLVFLTPRIVNERLTVR
jgi:type IV pilus assembly protein PilQ